MLDEESKLFFAGEEWAQIEGDARNEEAVLKDATKFVHNYFTMEDPNSVNTMGTELMLETTVGTMKLRGIIDRLDIDDDGELIVVDYKTGRAPGENFENGKLGGRSVLRLSLRGNSWSSAQTG